MAQVLLERACDRFRKEISEEKAGEIQATPHIDDVKSSIQQIETNLAAKGSLRNFRRLLPFLDAAERYSKVLETVCNGTDYVPWVWVWRLLSIEPNLFHAVIIF
jgi:hypothetical protein